MQKIKIAFIIDTIDYNVGGTERQLLLLMNNIDKKRFEPHLCVFRNSHWINDHRSKYRIFFFSFKSFFSMKSYIGFFRFIRYLKKERFDIVQTQFRDGNILGVLAAKLAGVRTIISSKRNEGYWMNKRELHILRMLNPWVRGFVTNSFLIKEFVERVEGVPSEKIKVIFNGIDFSKFPGKSREFILSQRNKFGYSENENIIVTVANLRPIKGYDVLIKAASFVIKNRPEGRFLIVGDGPEKQNLMNLARKLGVLDYINFLGRRDDIAWILSMSDIGVLTSHSEGLSNSIIEYMAAGLPVVCTNVGGNVELVEEGKNGFLVQPDNPKELSTKLLKLMDDKELAQKMGTWSFRRAENLYSLNAFIPNTEDYYCELISNSR